MGDLWARRKVSIVSWPFNYAAVSLRINLSNVQTPLASKEGTAHFIEHLIISFASEQLQRLYDVGGMYNGFATDDTVELVLLGPNPTVWDLEELVNPSLKEGRWASEYSVLAGEIDRYGSERSPKVLGTAESLEAASLIELKETLQNPRTELEVLEWSHDDNSSGIAEELLVTCPSFVLKLLYPEGPLPDVVSLTENNQNRTRVLKDLIEYISDPFRFLVVSSYLHLQR